MTTPEPVSGDGGAAIYAKLAELGLTTEEVSYECGCRSSREEFHDGSVHHMVVNHRGKVLVEEEFRGE